ncbi:MAG: hypothetical protein K6G51_07985 [Sphaerochaetaceae bacterium]|nr:hypothetical protein [Sphaerochaetaceae bacterium]
MIIFDTLSELESYLPALKNLINVITLLDRSIPYKDKAGVYSCPENKDVTYSVDNLLTSSKGVEFTIPEGRKGVIVTLEGEQIVSDLNHEKVFILSEGRFLALSEGTYRRGISVNLPIDIKDVIFII